MKTDVQVGGTDQLFNIIVAGRKLQESQGQRPLVGIICGILPGTDGVVAHVQVRRQHHPHSRHAGRYVRQGHEPARLRHADVHEAGHALDAGRRSRDREAELDDGSRHPRDVKMELAREIVSIFHGDAAAQAAEQHFVSVFQQHALPDEMEEVKIAQPMNRSPILLIFTQTAKTQERSAPPDRSGWREARRRSRSPARRR